MARKETITKTDILNAAFELASEEGFEHVTARTLAAKAGCSTQPIFRIYKNMEELLGELFAKIAVFFEAFYADFPSKSDTPFVDLGLAYVKFAQDHPKLFALLFASQTGYGKSLYDILNGSNGSVVREINKAKVYGCINPSAIFMKMWIFIHGCACMALTGDYDLNEEETKIFLEEAYQSFLTSLN